MNIGNKITWDISRENLAVLKGSVYQNQTTECYMHTTKTCLLVFFFLQTLMAWILHALDLQKKHQTPSQLLIF